jgi:hypothetical protein
VPYILIAVGIILFVTAIKGTTGKLGEYLGEDIFGARGYIYWIVAIFVVGAIGYIKPLQKLSDSFILLLVLVLLLGNKGFFAQFNAAIKEIGPSHTTG